MKITILKIELIHKIINAKLSKKEHNEVIKKAKSLLKQRKI